MLFNLINQVYLDFSEMLLDSRLLLGFDTVIDDSPVYFAFIHQK